MRLKITLLLIFGIISVIIFYIGAFNFVTVDTQFSNLLEDSTNPELNEVYQNFKNHSFMILIFAAILSLGVIIATLYLSKAITQPIESLEDSMKNFANTSETKENLFHKTHIKEFYELFQNFEKMAKAIKKTVELEKNLVETLKETDRQKNEFIAMISHELKSPLVTIKGYAYLLRKLKLGELKSDQKEAIDEIYDSSSRLEKLIGDILTAQKIEMGKLNFKKEPIKVSSFVDKLVKNEKDIAFDKNYKFVNSSNANCIIYSDKDRLTQVFTNLIRNAKDFISNQEGTIEVGSEEDADKVMFYVKDNGKGIPKDKMSMLFKKFYQVDTSVTRSHGGSGLGLAICRGIIEGLGGRIWAESEIGKGSSFYFTVPREVKVS